MRRLFPLIGVWLVLSVIMTSGFLLSIWPHRPHSRLGWTLLFLAALPLAALGEFLADRFVLHSDLGVALSSLGSGFVPSVVRILYVLVVYLAVAALAGLLVTRLSSAGWVSAL